MRALLIKLHDRLVDSVWFVPAAMALLAAAAALGTVELDRSLGDEWALSIGWVWAGSADGARSVLSVVAGSVMTVVSIVFSLTITTLAQTSSHFGPRVLRNFTADRGVRVTLGTFIATFVYCLLVLRTVRSVEEVRFVPFLSVNVGVAMALAALAVLIYFIHHVSQIIQGENLIADAGGAFQDALPRLFPERLGHGEPDAVPPPAEEWLDAPAVVSPGNGYLQRIDDQRLMDLAVRYDLCCKLERRPGDFVTRGSPLLLLATPGPRMTPRIERELAACFNLGPHRTPYQDPLYSLQQLAEIAAHALSPGINEPFTALTCIDWLSASLRGVASREMPAPLRNDPGGRLRVVTPPWSLAEMADAAFDQIRRYGASNAEVMARLVDVIAEVAPVLRRDADREMLHQHARLIEADAAEVPNATDRERVYRHCRAAQRALSEARGQTSETA